MMSSSVEVQEKFVSALKKQPDIQTLELLRQYGYTLRHPDAVVEFLSRHLSLLEILQKAPKQIHRHFGDGISSLEFV